MLIDPDHPFFRPLIVRILCVAFPLGWAIFELQHGAMAWAIAFGAAGCYLLWALFLQVRP